MLNWLFFFIVSKYYFQEDQYKLSKNLFTIKTTVQAVT